jgi:hypothetical protein
MSKQEPERSGEDLLIHVSNGMIGLLPPEELEKWAALEQSIEETRAEIAMLLATVRDRKLTDYQNKPQNPKGEAVLNKLSQEDREFAETAYPEELHRYERLLRREGRAELALVELIDLAEERCPDGEDCP